MTETDTIFAADIGGTHARLGIVKMAGADKQVISVHDPKTYLCANFPDLPSILDDYFQSLYSTPIKGAVMACAGYLDGDKVRATSMSWEFSLKEIREHIGIKDLFVINDYVAATRGINYLHSEDIVSINNANHRPDNEPVLVIGPGTGLGASVLIPGREHQTALPTEAGHSGLTPTNDLEGDVLKVLRERLGYVSAESVLSGPGLLNLYQALSQVMGNEASLKTPEEITKAALDDDNSAACKTLNLFCDWLGSTVGDFALVYGARGGVFLAGGILPSIKDFILRSNFMARFLDKGMMHSFLQAIPVNMVVQGHLGITGAAAWFKDLSETADVIPVTAYAGT